MSRKGIFMTFIASLVFMSLVMYMIGISDVFERRVIITNYKPHVSRLSYMSDMLSHGLAEVYGVEHSAVLDSNFTYRTFSSRALARNVTQSYVDFVSYINSTYSERVHANISLHANSSSYASAWCEDGIFLAKNFTLNETVVYLNASHIHNASLSLYVNSTFYGGTPWSETANRTQVYLHVESLNGTDVDGVYSLDVNAANSYVLNYSDGIITVVFGNVGMGAEGLKVSGPLYSANLTVAVNASYSDGGDCYFTNSSFSFSQPLANSTGVLKLLNN